MDGMEVSHRKMTTSDLKSASSLSANQFTKRRSSLLPSEECYPLGLQGTKRQVHFFTDDENKKDKVDEFLASDIRKEIILNPREIMREPSNQCSPYGSHAMVNRSDSEKLSDVKLLFKSEAHIQNLYQSDLTSSSKKRETSLAHLEDVEMYDAPQSTYWFDCLEQGDSVEMQKFNRRWSIVAPTEECELLSSYRRENRGPDGNNGDDRERILEVLREIVRKCTSPDPAKRPAARDVLMILNMKSTSFREKIS